MSDLDSVVTVNISVAEASLGRKGFGVPLIAGYHTKWPERVKTYRKLKDLTTDGFAITDPIYRAAKAMLRSEITVSQFKVGRLEGTPVTQLVTLTPVAQARGRYVVNVGAEEHSVQLFKITPSAVNSATYSVTIDDVEYTFTADASATAAEIVTGLSAAINADDACPVDASGSVVLLLTATDQANVVVSVGANLSDPAAPTAAEIVTAAIAAINAGDEAVTAAGATTLTLTADVAGINFHYTHSNNLTAQDTTANAAIATELGAIADADDDWYGIALLGMGKAEILAAADYIEGTEKILFAVSGDSDIPSASTTDVASEGVVDAYNHTALFRLEYPGEYGNAGLIGRFLSRDPGSSSASFKNLPGITPTKYTSDQITNLKAKNVVYYTTIAGRQVTQNGKMLSGRWIDIQVGLDFLKARIQEEIFLTIVSQEKVPYDEIGMEMFGAATKIALLAAEQNGIVARGSWTVTVPDIEDTTVEQREQRLVDAVEWTARLLGAAESVIVNGSVTY